MGVVENGNWLVIEEKTKNNTQRIEKLEETVPILNRLETILEMQVEINRTQSVQMEQQIRQSERTFNAINQSLTQLNFLTEQLKSDIDNINGKVDRVEKENGDRIEEVREKLEAEMDKGKISVNDVGVKIFYGLVTIIPSLILAWILAKSGLN